MTFLRFFCGISSISAKYNFLRNSKKCYFHKNIRPVVKNETIYLLRFRVLPVTPTTFHMNT